MENIKKIVKGHINRLNTSEKNFASIYDIMFSIPDNIMVETTDGLEIKKITYRQMKQQIKLAATSLKKRNIENQFIGLAADNGPEWIILFWAILMSGNKPYLINLRFPVPFTSSILKTLNVNYVIEAKQNIDYGTSIIDFEDLIKENSIYDNFHFANEIAISTSATTLNQKICIYNGLEFSEQVLNTDYVLSKNKLIKTHYKGSLKLLAFLPLYHIFGLSAMYFWFCFFGRTLVFLKDYSPSTILNTIKKHKVTHIFAVPLLWHTIEKNVLKEVNSKDEKTKQKFYKGLKTSTKLQKMFPTLGRKIAKRKFAEVNNKLFGDSVAFCISGGSYLKDSTMYLMNALGYPMHNGYGMSEIGITSVELSKKITDRNKNSIGKPFTSIEYKINENQELLVRGKSICHNIIINGVHHHIDDWFNTNDVVRVDKDGRYYIIGRKSELIIGENGENISPDEIEKEFLIQGALNFSVMGDQNKEKLIMVVQLPKDILKITLYRINESINEQNNKLPLSSRITKIYYTYDPIMSASAIKVSRKYLENNILNKEIKLLTINEIGVSEFTNENANEELQTIILELFSKTLGIPSQDIDLNANFMLDLGGTSLDYFSLVSAINEKFNIDLKMDYEHMAYSVNDFEKVIKELL